MTTLTLRAHTGQYVCAELDGRLVANREVAGPWETFTVEPLEGAFALKTAHGFYVCAEGGGGRELIANRTVAGPWERFRSRPQTLGGLALQTDNGHYWCAEEGGGGAVNATRTAAGPWETFNGPVVPTPPPAPQPGTARTGIPYAHGRRFVDDQGMFCPLGGTLFWTMRGWKFERDRVQKNLEYLANARFDYVRILAQVGWPGNEIDEDWPDHVQILREVIDYAYSLGLRTQVTGVGGGDYDAQRVIDHVIQAVQGREGKVIYAEVCNEWFGTWDGSEAQMQRLGERLMDALPSLVALSAPQEEMATARSQEWVEDGYANMATFHGDRGDQASDWKWRHVRRAWEPRNPSFPSSHGEPGGPLSSVASYMEPIHLVMSRAVGILCGFESYCLHNAAGIYGQVRPPMGSTPGRPANLWETPGIDRCMAVVRALDGILPPNPSEGEATRKGLGPHPLTADVIWPDGGDHGVVRDYARVNGATFWQCLQGIKAYVNVTARQAYALTLIDPVTQETREMTVSAGKTLRVDNSPSKDTRGYGAWIVRGRNI